MDRPRLVDVTLSSDTNIFASGDVIADTQVIAGAVFDKNRPGVLDSLTVIDEDDQGAAIDIYLFSADAALGTENGAPAITDALARNLLGIIPVATADYRDLGGVKVANLRNLGVIVQPALDTNNIYVGVVNGAGTPTYTASGLKLRLGTFS